MGKWKVRLACGHYSREGTAADRDSVIAAGVAPCFLCHDAQRVADPLAVRRGGLGPRQSMERMMHAKEAQGFVQSRHFRTGGLVTHLRNANRSEAWCRYCDGRNPEMWRRLIARSEAEVDAWWREHKASGPHRRKRLMASDAESIAVAAEKVNRARRPKIAPS